MDHRRHIESVSATFVISSADTANLFSLQKNIKVKIIGRVVGYDDLLEQVKLDQCTRINK